MKKIEKQHKSLGGRPKKYLDIDVIKGMCKIQCTEEEICLALNVDSDTLNKRIKEHEGVGFSEFFKQNRSAGKVSLRRSQWQAAINGNVTMLIWLGKQFLGQKDKFENDVVMVDVTPPIFVLNEKSVEELKNQDEKK